MTMLTGEQVLAWLRRLVNDVPASHAEVTAGDGTTTTFWVTTPPISTVLGVSVANVLLSSSDYTITDNAQSITFAVAPSDEEQVVIKFTNSEWSDTELQTYLDAASQRWEASLEQVPQIYQAALYALDTTLMGLAAALNFGAGAEQFDMASVFNRLLSLRSVWAAVIQEQVDNTAAIAFVDVELDLDDPSPSWLTDPRGWWWLH